MSSNSGRSLHRAIGWLFCLLALSGCRLDVRRVRSGTPLKFEEFEELNVGESRRDDALEKLDAPDEVDWENDKARLTWKHLDATLLQLRLQLPLAFFGYRHTLFQYFENSDLVNEMELVFDKDGFLEQKDLRLPDAYKREPTKVGSWRLHFTPRFEHSLFLIGDADFRDYSELFENGIVAGLEVGVQPVAPVTLALGGRYQNFQGETFALNDGSLIALDDLELFTLELLLRFQLPLRVFSEGIENLWVIMLEDDPADHDGWVFFVEGGVGVTVNENVALWDDGVLQGDFFQSGAGLSNSLATGLEYSWENVSVRAGVSARSTDAFDAGNSGFATGNADSFSALLGMVNLSVKL